MLAHARPRRTLAALAAVLATALLLQIFATSPAHAGTGRRHMLNLTNEDRAARDLEALRMARAVTEYAERHSKAMAREGYLYHSSEAQLRKALEDLNWSIAGENVGVGGSLESLESAFMASKLHRENILRSSFERAAIGVYEDGDVIWVTVIFYGS